MGTLVAASILNVRMRTSSLRLFTSTLVGSTTACTRFKLGGPRFTCSGTCSRQPSDVSASGVTNSSPHHGTECQWFQSDVRVDFCCCASSNSSSCECMCQCVLCENNVSACTTFGSSCMLTIHVSNFLDSIRNAEISHLHFSS